ncbi:mannose-1-phosphate guanylyltransferase [Thermodesulfobacteriota bacterium]
MLAVIMAGGRGTRFWPVSRRNKPKQFLDITGRGPMVLETCERLGKSARDDEIILVVGQEHLKEAEDLFRGREVHILAEPVGRNTAPCMGLGAVYAKYLGYEGPVAFLPADHFIRDREPFIEALRVAEELAKSGGIATLGIQPDRPSTGYGYIKRKDEPLKAKGLEAYEVSGFVEKPDAARALEYMNDGTYYWNGGIFVATPDTILKELETHLPDHWKGLKVLQKALGGDGFDGALKEVYEGFERISFDYGIMEKTEAKVYVVPCQCGWSDVGSWESLYELTSEEHDPNDNKKEGQAVLVDCEGSFVSVGGERVVTCLGLKDCLVVDTGDALLVADMKRTQDIRRIIDRLEKEGREDLL